VLHLEVDGGEHAVLNQVASFNPDVADQIAAAGRHDLGIRVAAEPKAGVAATQANKVRVKAWGQLTNAMRLIQRKRSGSGGHMQHFTW
jgi:hypothetical protein